MEKMVHKDVAKYRGMKVLPLIIGNEAFERLASMSSLTNMIAYLTTVFHLKKNTSHIIFNVLSGTLNVIPLLGAFVSDSYLGRYKTLAVGSICSLLTIIALSGTISKMHPPKCALSEDANCTGPMVGQFAILLSGFGFLVIGAGGIRPCNLPFGADQFDRTQALSSQAMTSFYNWFYFAFTFVVAICLALISYVQLKVSWTIGLVIPACLMFLSCAIFLAGSNLYVKVEAKGIPLTSMAQVLVAATKKRKLPLPENVACLFNHVPSTSIKAKLAYMNQLRFLEKSAIRTSKDQINPDGSAVDSWTLSSIQQVEEVNCILRVIPIWVSAIFYYVVIKQQQYYVVLQALQLDRRVGKSGFEAPAASYLIFALLALTLCIAVYDRILVPIFAKFTGRKDGKTVLQRMGIGIFISILTMVISAFVEGWRRYLVLEGATIGLNLEGWAISSLSGLWLTPQLVLAGLAYAFFSVGESQFYNEQFPENMRSIATAMSSAGEALSSFVSGFLISIVQHITGTSWLSEDLNKGSLDYFFTLVAALELLNFVYFLFYSIGYQYKRTINNSDDKELS